jgi:hypothetical protein
MGLLFHLMTVVEIAKSYLGKTEKPNNAGFNDRIFEQKMEDVGFQRGQAWCCYFAELCFKEANQDRWFGIEGLFSASTVQTFQNFKKAKYKISQKPIVGSLVIWQNYKNDKPQWSGHAGIVVEVIDDVTFKSIEGNTNDDGSREGYEVALKTRKVRQVKNGLQVLGFIKI